MSSQPARVYLNGYYRGPSDSASEFTVTLPQAIIGAQTMSINSATIPFLCYTFDLSESVFYYQAGSPVVQSVTLNLQKVYTSLTQFIADFKASFPVGLNIDVTTDAAANDGILTITCPTGINVIGIAQKEYNWDTTYFNNCADRLGFYNASGTPLVTTPTQTSFKASGPVIMLRTTSIYVGVDLVGGDSFTTNTPSQAISSILFQLPITSGTYGSVLSYFNNDYLLFVGSELPNAIYNVSVTLYDDTFNNLQLLPSAKVLLELSFKYEEELKPKPRKQQHAISY